MSFGIGAFPFGIFATAFNINDGRPPPGTEHPNISENSAEKQSPPLTLASEIMYLFKIRLGRSISKNWG